MSLAIVEALLVAVAAIGAEPSPAAEVDAGATAAPPAETRAAPNDPPKRKVKSKRKSKAKDTAVKAAATPTAPARGGASDEPFVVEADARLGVGALTGRSIHRLPAALSVVAAEVQPALTLGPVELRGELELEHEETWSVPLRSSSGSASCEAELRPWRELRAAAELGVLGVARPGWPDPYQPIDGDVTMGLAPTDRGSHLDLWVQGRALWVPAPRHFARVRYRFTRVDSADDPAFDALARPNHLTPFDHDEHAAELSWRGGFGALWPGVAVGASRTDWFFVFSRDAGTGLTHTGEGGAPPNPLLAENALDLEPELELELLGRALELKLAWRLRLVQDPWQGYQSRVEDRVRFDAEWHVGPRELEAAVEAKLAFEHRLYAETGYAPGEHHPALDWGERRESRTARVALAARFPARSQVRAFLEAEGATYLTNFPDYVPGVYPASQAYEVRRDWQHARVVVGVEMSTGR